MTIEFRWSSSIAVFRTVQRSSFTRGVWPEDIKHRFSVFQAGDFVVIGKLRPFVGARLLGVGEPEIADSEESDNL